MTALTWLLAGGAVLVTPMPGRPRHRQTSSPGRARRRPALPVVAAVSAGAACLALLGSTVGTVAALLVVPTVWRGTGWYARRQAGRGETAKHPAVPLVLDLAAAALRAGRPPADALSAAAPAAPRPVGSAFEQVAGLLRLGADPERAWRVLAREGPLGSVATVAVRSAASGARLAGAFERLAAELRAESAAGAASRAQRAGVIAMAPLGACFLPSFVLLGVVPVVVGMGRSVLGGVA